MDQQSDADKQTAINVFLGVDDIPPTNRGLPPKSYKEWYNPMHLERAFVLEECQRRLEEFSCERADFWVEYYRPLLLTYLAKHFAYRMNSTQKLPGCVYSQ
jgi:phosphatidylinositol 3,5-bisphosphate 5-phosphatase